MHWIDWIICVPLLWGFYTGFTKGLIIELASIAAFVLGIWGGIYLSDNVSGLIMQKLGVNTTYLPFISFALVFIIILITVFTLAKLLEGLIKITMLSLFNKIAGGLFGLLKFSLLLCFGFYFVHFINTKIGFYSSEIASKSILYKPFLSASDKMIEFLSDDNGRLKQLNFEKFHIENKLFSNPDTNN